MAGLSDLAALLAGQPDQAALDASDPYLGVKRAPDAIGQILLQSASNPNYSTRDKLITGIVTGLLSGGLGSLSSDYQDRAKDAYTETVLKSIGGGDAERPSVLPASIFKAAQQQGSVFKLKNTLDMAEKDRTTQNDIRKSIAEEAGKELVKNPRKAPQLMPILSSFFTNGKMPIATAVPSGQGATESTTPSASPELSDIQAPPAGMPKKFTVDPITRYNELVDSGLGDESARAVLNKELEQQQNSQKELDTYLSTGRDSLNSSLQKLTELKNALTGAGQTGGVMGEETGRGIKLAVQDMFGSDEASRRRAARADLGAQAITAAGEIRKMFPGSVSDKEFAKYLEAVPGTDKTPEANAAIVDRLSRAASLGKQRLDFITQAKNAGYSLSDASDLYERFNSLVPMFQGGEINPDRLSIDPKEIPMDRLATGELEATFQKAQEEAAKAPPAAPGGGGAPPTPPTDETAPAAKGGSIKDTLNGYADAVLSGAAKFGNSALFGLPKHLVAVGDTIHDEAKDLLGTGDGRSAAQHYTQSLASTDAALADIEKASPVITGASGIAGAVFSPVNKLKIMKSIFAMPGLIGTTARAGTSAAMSLTSDAIDKGEAPSLGKAENAALFSAVLDAATKGAGKLVGPASTAFKRMIGVTAANYRQAAAGLKPEQIQEAKSSFDKALGIVRTEHGITPGDLVKSDESVMQNIASKAVDSIESRQDQISQIMTKADQAVGKKNGFLVMGQKLREAIDRGGTTDGPEIQKQGNEILKRFNDKYKGKAPLSAIWKELKALNRSYQPGQSYMDAKTAVADDFRRTLHDGIDRAVAVGLLPTKYAGLVKKLNLETRDLVRLKDATVSKLPGAMAQDFITTAQKGMFTTGGAATQGAANVGNAMAGEAGSKAAIATAIAAYSKRIGRPVADLIATGKLQDFLASPELRTTFNEVQGQSSDSAPLPDFFGPDLRPNAGKTRELFSPKPKQQQQEMPRDFQLKLNQIAGDVGADPTDLLKVMRFETGGSLKSDTKNKAGSGATGLIQFMPSTAKDLTGADSKAAAIKIMSEMTPTEQLDYVGKYLSPFKGKLKSMDDLYMAILYPKAIGKDSNYALFEKGTRAYWQNRGLDLDGDGTITKAEAASSVGRG